MAKKKAARAGGARRKRRSPEEMIADLQEEIRRLETKARAKELKQSPSMKQTLQVVRAIDKGLQVAEEEGNNEVRHILSDARKPLEEFLGAKGVQLPKARKPRGRRPKSAS